MADVYNPEIALTMSFEYTLHVPVIAKGCKDTVKKWCTLYTETSPKKNVLVSISSKDTREP